MGQKKRPTIAVVVGTNGSEYVNDLISGFRYCAQEENVNLVFLREAKVPKYCSKVLSDEFDDLHNFHFHKIHDYMRYIHPDVIILAYGSMTSFRYVKTKQEYWQNYRGIPCILIEDISENPEVPYLISDNYGGMRQMVEHLTQHHGYRRICFLTGPVGNYDSQERLRAYRDVMQEAGLLVTEQMIAYGDYTDQVVEQVDQLLDDNPDIEALVCANDNMAKAAYHVCERRGLMVGSDIAITGYDNSNTSNKLNPALTTVSHSAVMYAYHALQAAISAYHGQKVTSRKIDTILCVRDSCGCNRFYTLQNREQVDVSEICAYISSRIEQTTEVIFGNTPYQRVKQAYAGLLEEFFEYIILHVFDESDTKLSREVLSRYLRRISSYSMISNQVIGDQIHGLLENVRHMITDDVQKDKMVFVLAVSRDFFHYRELLDIQTTNEGVIKRTWYLTSFTRDLLTAGMKYEDNLRCILERMRAMGIHSTYLLFFQEAVTCTLEDDIQYPKQIYLAAYYNDKEFVTTGYDQGIPISDEEGIVSMIPEDKTHICTVYLLFSGNRHYGLMLCEHEERDNEFLLECSLQLGSTFLHLALQDKQRRAQEDLESTISRIEEQNRILNFVSQEDVLTQLLNRRGFMEKSIEAVAAHQGQLAAMFFADLDHLKEINDCFGHKAGDFAICQGASYLTSCLPKDAIIARLGGDEYVALVFVEPDSQVCSGFSKGIIALIHQRIAEFNACSDKPYLVELSMGSYEFVCDEDTCIEAIINLSDEIMYHEKQKRRTSIKKSR